MGLDKRYVADVDLTSTTATGDPQGDTLETHPAPSQDAFEAALAGLRGDVELPIPAASAVKIGGERAYKLARRGIAVEMPLRRSHVYALDVISYTGETATISLHVGSGTYVRAIATALGGHCLTLRRTAVGPFGIDEAAPIDPPTLLPIRDVLERLPADAIARVPAQVVAGVLALADDGADTAA